MEKSITFTAMINEEAQLAKDFALYTSEPFFLTGKAGTGKTTLLKTIIEESDKNIIVVAPTGVAAINAGGSTIHSMFTFPLKIFVPSFDRVDMNVATNKALLKNHLRYRKEKRKMIQELDLLIIDEISMVRADLLDAIDFALKYTRKNQTSFGGVQVMVIGDLFQLSPIARDNDWAILRQYYKSPYFFHSQVWQEIQPITIELKKVYRQEEEEFIHILNGIRNGEPTDEMMDTLNMRYDTDFITGHNDAIILTTHNYKANDINLKALNKLDTKTYKFKAEVTGNFSESSYPVSEVLTLKVGAQIMFLRNDTEDGMYFNGKLAVIESITKDDIKVKFLDDNSSYFLKKELWENKVYKLDDESNEIVQEVEGSFKQYPVRLAWAVTIHKSQGLTFDKAVVDIADAFANGQTYVALSRCTNLDGLILKSKLTKRSVLVNPTIQQFYDNIPLTVSLVELLKSSKVTYSCDTLKAAFNFSFLIDDIEDWIKVLGEKNIPEKPKVVQMGGEIKRQLKSLNQVASSFRAQLDHLFRNFYQDGNREPIIDRSNKAIGFFVGELIEKIIKPMHLHINEYAHKKGVKVYMKSTESLQKGLWAKVNQIYTLSFQGDILWKEEKINVHHLPKAKIAISEKAKKGSTYDVTLQLYKDGKKAKEIAEIRSMALTTIEGHLAKWVEKGELEITEFISSGRLNKILPHYEKVGDRKLTTFKTAVPFNTTFSELKFVQAYYNHEMENQGS